jgi:hypothetical protein
VFAPVLAKHSKNFSIEDSFAIGVDRIQRNFGSVAESVGRRTLSGSGRHTGKSCVTELGALPPTPRNLPLCGQNGRFGFDYNRGT